MKSLGGDRPVPTGTVTFLFTDIEGSTKRWEREPLAMRAALREHDELLRKVVADNGGHVFKTVGDAFCVAFQEPHGAIVAAVDAQRALAAADFSSVGGVRVRMALHAGASDERDGDYFGPTLNRTARLLGIGHGGQVLLSGVVADLVEPALVTPAGFIELGSHRLRDLAKRERVVQLVAPGLPHEFPALRSVDARPNNLPSLATSFFGRDSELAQIASLLRTHRVVTLVGPGGIGKTRASLHAGAALLDEFPDGVWFVELAPLAEPGRVAAALGAPMGASLEGEDDSLAAVVNALGTKRSLVIFDNCEHVLDGVATIVSELVSACPNVRVLASSRERLAVAAEAVYDIPALTISDAQALFVARAQASNARFQVDDANAGLVAAICMRLDGMPLALELAAARVRSLSLTEINRGLDNRFAMLRAGRRDAVPRQQTLRALIDWSFDLLDVREQTLFRRLAIFVDGFTLDSARAVCAPVAAGDALDPLDIRDLLSSLVDKSLVVADTTSETARYRLLETMRAYGLERLEETAERTLVADRHLAHFRRVAESAAAAFEASGRDADVMALLEPDLEDVRAALAWSLSGGDPRAGAALAIAIARQWTRLNLGTEGLERLEAFIAAVGDDAALLAGLWSSYAWLAGNSMRSSEGFEAAIIAVRYARKSGEPSILSSALARYSLLAARLRRFDEAVGALDESEALDGPGAAPGRRLTLLEMRGYVALLRQDLIAAATAFEDQRALLRAAGDEYGEANAILNIAETEHARGNTSGAIASVREILPNAARLLGREQNANLLANLAGYLLATGEVDEALASATQAIELLATTDPASTMVALALEHLALGRALNGDHKSAARLLGYCEAALSSRGYTREFNERKTHVRLTKLLAESISPDELEGLVASGASWTPKRALAAAH